MTWIQVVIAYLAMVLISCYICEMLCGYIVIFAGLANVVVVVNGLLCCGAPLAVSQKGKVSTRVAVH